MTPQQESAIDTVRREVEDGTAVYCKPIKREVLRRLLETIEGTSYATSHDAYMPHDGLPSPSVQPIGLLYATPAAV